MNKKRMISAIVTLVFLVGMMASCGIPLPDNIRDMVDLDQHPADTVADQSRDDESVEYTDEEGFVTVWVKDGEAELHYNVDTWAKSWEHMSEFVDDDTMTQLREKNFPVKGLSSKIVDVFVGAITGIGDHYLLPFSPPMIVLLLEDGTVTYIESDIFAPFFGDGVSGTSLQGITDIVSIKYESSGEGIGDATVYATDSEGKIYDTLIAWNLRNLLFGQWLCMLSMNDSGNADVCGYLEFFPGNEVRWFVGWPNSDIAYDYTGTYELTLAEGQEYRPGTITLNMEEVFVIDGEVSDKPFNGTYFIESTYYGELRLFLYPLDGDYLYAPDIDVYEFFLANAYGENDENNYEEAVG